MRKAIVVPIHSKCACKKPLKSVVMTHHCKVVYLTDSAGRITPTRVELVVVTSGHDVGYLDALGKLDLVIMPVND